MRRTSLLAAICLAAAGACASARPVHPAVGGPVVAQLRVAERNGPKAQQLPWTMEPVQGDRASAQPAASARESGAPAQRNSSTSKKAAWWIGGAIVLVALIVQSMLF